MKIDKTWRHGKTIGIHDSLRAAADPPHFNNATILNRHITEVGRQSTAIVNAAAFDELVIRHEKSSLVDPTGCVSL